MVRPRVPTASGGTYARGARMRRRDIVAGGLKAHAPSFGRPGFATGSSGSSDAAAHACGAGDRAVALAIMRRGAASGTVRCRTRASPTIAKSSAIDQLNVAMDSIRFPTTIRQPRYAVRTRETTSGYQGNPDGRGNAHVCPDATGQVKAAAAAATRGARYIRLRGLDRANVRTAASRTAPVTSRRQAAERGQRKSNGTRMVSALLGRIQSRESMESESGEIQRGGNLPARRSGIWPRLRKPEGYSPIWPAMTARQAAGPNLAWVPTPSARRCAVRAPSRASGNQSQSR